MAWKTSTGSTLEPVGAGTDGKVYDLAYAPGVSYGEVFHRAGATVDYELDEADRGTNKIICPVLVLWGEKGALPKWYEVLDVWRDWADDVKGRGIDCGHYLAEEAPEETGEEVLQFLKE